MRTPAAVLALAFAAATSAHAQTFAGSYAVQGGTVPVTLTLRQDAGGRITGSLQGQTAFQVQAQLQNTGMFVGYAANPQGRLYIAGQLDGSGNLGLVMAEVDASGQPQMNTARQLMAMRTGGQAVGPTGGPAVGRSGGGGQPDAAGAVAGNSPVDRQLAQLLLRSAWCSFSYNQTSGTTSTERIVFRQDGSGARSSGRESVSSGMNGTAYGASSGGGAFQWRLQNGSLIVSDGTGQSVVPLQVTQNSSGYPIITANGTEYSMCN